MRDWLIFATETAILVIDAMALVVIVFGTVEAFVTGLRLMITRSANGAEKREVWLRYGRALVAGLTFQLAADIIETSITTEWEAVGRIAAIAVIRTFLNYFLERDLTDIRERQTKRRRLEDPKGVQE
jgi:uncharacterized membrane protein